MEQDIHVCHMYNVPGKEIITGMTNFSKTVSSNSVQKNHFSESTMFIFKKRILFNLYTESYLIICIETAAIWYRLLL